MVHYLLNKIINHFVSHFANQNDKVQIDCLIMVIDPINLSQLTKWFLLHLSFWVSLMKKLSKKTMNCNSTIYLNIYLSIDLSTYLPR